MEEENRDLNESVPEGTGISKRTGIAIGLVLGFFLELAAFFCLISASEVGIIVLFFLYTALIVIFYVKGKSSISLGLILSLFILLLIFGGCLTLLTLP